MSTAGRREALTDTPEPQHQSRGSDYSLSLGLLSPFSWIYTNSETSSHSSHIQTSASASDRFSVSDLFFLFTGY
ncbi:hypothetical protein GN956_G6005 [Arapaima gigas]